MNSTTDLSASDDAACSRPACCLTEAGLECTVCNWHGCEDSAKEREDPRNGIMWDCPICGEECAHTPMDETTDYDGPCVCGERRDLGAASGQLPTPDEIRADPDRILELYDACPECGSTALEALTWTSIGLDDVTVGCWNCDWIIAPPGYTPPDEPEDDDE